MKQKKRFTYKVILSISLLILISIVISDQTLTQKANEVIKETTRLSTSIDITKQNLNKSLTIKKRESEVKNNDKDKDNLKLTQKLKSIYPGSLVKVTTKRKVIKSNINFKYVLVEIKTNNGFISYNALVNSKSNQIVNKWNQSYPETMGKSNRLNIDIRNYAVK